VRFCGSVAPCCWPLILIVCDKRATAGWPRHTCRTWQRLQRSTLICKSRYLIYRTVSGVVARDGPEQAISAASAALKPAACGAPLRGFGA
jgi:hypothetical protein